MLHSIIFLQQYYSFVVMIGFFVMIPMAFLFAGVWPKVQAAIYMLQDLFGNANVFAPIGITLAFLSTAKKEKRKQRGIR